MWEYLAPYRQKREELAGDLDYVESILQKGAGLAGAEARKTLDAARVAMGLAG